MRKCGACGGTGVLWSLRTWFTYDGYRASKCGYCDANGRSRAAFDPEQGRHRRLVASDPRFRAGFPLKSGVSCGEAVRLVVSDVHAAVAKAEGR